MRLRLCAPALSILLLAPLPALASTFVVTPTEVDLSTSTTSALSSTNLRAGSFMHFVAVHLRQKNRSGDYAATRASSRISSSR